MENRPPLHRHGFRHHRFRAEIGLAMGSASFLKIMAGFFNYDTKLPAVQGYRVCSGLVVGALFGVCTLLLIAYQINKKMTIQMADELAERRKGILAV
jgi:glycoside/pentoside/hexuronide:cation symporter, GPH family